MIIASEAAEMSISGPFAWPGVTVAVALCVTFTHSAVVLLAYGATTVSVISYLPVLTDVQFAAPLRGSPPTPGMNAPCEKIGNAIPGCDTLTQAFVRNAPVYVYETVVWPMGICELAAGPLITPDNGEKMKFVATPCVIEPEWLAVNQTTI